MSVYAGPEIADDGLVFYYDMGNTQKSWKGAPATNFVVQSPTWAGDGSNQTAFVKDSVEVTDTSLMYNGLKTFLWSPGTSLNCYLQSDDIVGGSGTTSTVWTFSCYVKAEDRRAITSMNVYLYYPSSDGFAAGTITDAGDGWYRISRTRTGTNSSIGLMGFTGFAANIRYYLSGAMLTKNDIVVAPLNGNETRSNTQAILDLTNNNTVTATSLTYASNNTFSFNGIDNSISISNGINYASGFTLAAWINPQSIGGGTFGRIFDKTPALGTTSGFGFYLSGTNQLNFSVNNIGTLTTASSTISLNNWQYVVATVTSAGDAAIYIDAVSRASGTTGATSGITTTNLLTVGNRSGATDRTFDGDIDVASLNNRALTSQEIQQNFNATKGRYGL
jgi:hypothetical protein